MKGMTLLALSVLLWIAVGEALAGTREPQHTPPRCARPI
jgi:hypothetical protein